MRYAAGMGTVFIFLLAFSACGTVGPTGPSGQSVTGVTGPTGASKKNILTDNISTNLCPISGYLAVTYIDENNNLTLDKADVIINTQLVCN